NYLDKISETEKGTEQIESLKLIFEDWLSEKYHPDVFTTGGTINTHLTKDGSRIPDKQVQKKILSNTDDDTRKKVIVYEHAIDSSNQNLYTQEKLMNELGKVAFEDVKSLEDIEITFEKPGKYISIDKIPYYFNFPKPAGPGTVITHGTDTLVENAALSSYMMLPKTLVWTGSWASPDEPYSDATSNIEKAKILANNSLTPIGVYIVIGDEIHLATRTKKINTHPWISKSHRSYSNKKPWRKDNDYLSYFGSMDDEPVGYFDKFQQIFFSTKFLKTWEEILFKRFDNYFPLKKIKGLKPAYVEHVYINEHTPREVLRNLLDRLSSNNERCGAIIDGNITGNPNFNDFLEAIYSMDKDKGIFIITPSKTKLSMAYKNIHLIAPVQLRIKLSALMGRQDVSNNSVMLLLDENLSGEVLDKEISEISPLSIPRKFYEKGEFIIAFPGMTRKIIDDAVNNIKNKIIPEGQTPIIFINGFGDGHIPIGYMNIEERLINGFQSIDSELANKLIESIKNELLNNSEQNEFSINNILKHLQKLTNNSENQTKQLLKKAFMNSNEILASLGNAIEKGIEVLMGTKVEFAIPDLSAYEIGTILNLIGVKPIIVTTNKYFEDF
ncbi:MAG: asparaginase domain-containing protein, partial [Cyanobacteriota bacterium]